jgi:glycosyltransferase involved in cell wall biosynthesis
MRILLLSTAHDARDDRLYYKEARSLAKEHQVDLLAPLHAIDKAWDDPAVRFEELKIGPSKLARICAVFRVLVSRKVRGYDVVHVCDTEMLLAIPLLKAITGAKIVCDIWEANYELLLGDTSRPSVVRRLLARTWQMIERRVAARSDLVLTADARIAEGLGTNVHPVVIYNYPVLSVLRSCQKAGKEMRFEMEGKRLVVYAGSMTRARGVLEAVEMMACLKTTHPQTGLLLIGRLNADLKQEVIARIARFQLEKMVILVDWVEHSIVGGFLRCAEIGLVPFSRTAKFEKNIPQKIFEYWAFGIPVVATDLPPIRDYVDACKGGILVDRNDPAMMAEAVRSLLDDPVLRHSMGARGKSMVDLEWCWDKMENVLLAAYRRLKKRDSL